MGVKWGACKTTGNIPDWRGKETIPASVNDQWNFLIKTIWDQMIHLVICFEGHIDETILDLAVRDALDSQAITRTRFIPGDPSFFELARPDSEMPPWTIIRAEGPGNHCLEELLSTPLDPLKGPMVRIRLIRDGDDLLCLSFNHTITDAYGVKSFGSLIARLYRAKKSGSAYLPLENTQERSFSAILSLFSDIESRDAPGLGETRQGGWKIPFHSFHTGKRQYVTHTIERELFSCIRRYARIHGITINDLLLSSYILALSESAPVPAGTCNPVLTSIDLRRYLSPDRYPSLANLSVAFELPVIIPPGQTHSEIVRHIHDLMSVSKSGHAGIGAAVLLCREFGTGFRQVEQKLKGMEDMTRQGLLGKNPFFSNLGVIPEGVIDYSEPVRNAWMLGPVEYPPGFGLAASTFRDCITLSAGFSGEALDREWVVSLLSSVALHLSRFTSRE